MAKLNAKNAKAVKSAEGGFEPIPDGYYHAALVDVDSDRSGKAGPYWSWEFKIVAPSHVGRRLWNNTTLAEGKQFGLKATFDAFGVEPDTDTDDLCGRIVKLQVGHRTIQEGQRQGELANTINRVLKPDADVVASQPAATPEPEDVFG